MRIIKSSLIYSAFTSISRVAGFIRDIIFANYLGAGIIADVFYVAFRFPNTFRRIFSEGAFNSAFVPIYSKLLSEPDDSEAKKFAGSTLVLLIFITSLIVIIGEIFMPQILKILAPGFSENSEKFVMLISSSRIIFPFLTLVSVVSILSSILNSHDKFALSAAMPIILNIALSLSVLTAAYSSENYLMYMSWGVIISGFIQIFFLIISIRKNKILIQISKDYFSKPLTKFYKLFFPSMLSSGILQINIFIGTLIATYEPGAVSYLYYADRIYQLPLALIGIAIGITLLPNISKQIKISSKYEVNNMIEKTIIYSLLLAIPASVALFILPELIIKILFERGAFDQYSTYASGLALKFFSLGLIAFILTKILTPIYFAFEDPKPPLRFAIITVLINTTLSIYLFSKFGFLGIAIATSISAWINVILLYINLRSKNYFLHSNKLLIPLGIIILSSFVLLVYLYYIQNFYLIYKFSNFYYEALFFLLIIFSAFVLYFLTIGLYKPFSYVNLKKKLFLNE